MIKQLAYSLAELATNLLSPLCVQNANPVFGLFEYGTKGQNIEAEMK